MWDDVETFLTGLENVYFDTAMAATYMQDPQIAMRIINKHPIENIFMGSDCPWGGAGSFRRFYRVAADLR